jgi:hypothetical protein
VVPPLSRETINVADTVPNEWSVSTKVASDKPLAVERSMYWNSGGEKRRAGLGSIGLNAPARKWYLAEGSTGSDSRGAFETWVLVQNPGSETANVKLSYLTPLGKVEGPGLALGPGTRQTVSVADKVPNEWSVSTVVESDKPVAAERSMYWNAPGEFRQAALNSIGASGPSSEWYFAEGSTAASGSSSFETWITLENPLDDIAMAKLYYQTPGGQVEGPEVTLEPFTRKTVNVSDTVPDAWSVSTRVAADAPVVAERSTYWNAEQYRQLGQGSIGATATHTEWLTPEGSTGADASGSFETWILVQNPSSETVQAQLTYMLSGTSVDGPTLTLPPLSRSNVLVSDTVKDTWSVSTMVTSEQPLIVECAMYWNAASQFRRAGLSSKGYAPFGTE